jgi:RNA polymerase sigma-70 factor (ECF subfamily)
MQDRAEITTLYEQYAPKLRGYIGRRLRSPEVAEDITQDVFLEIWRKRARLAGAGPSLLFTIARWRIADYCDRQMPCSLEDSEGAFTIEAHDADPQEVIPPLLAIERAIRRLTPCQATAVCLRADGLPYPEIDARMGLSDGISRGYVYDGRKRFAAALGGPQQ